MAWIELHQTMPNHRKTLRFARLLGVSRYEAIGLMVTLWTWGLDNAANDGLLSRVTVTDVADAVMYDDSERLCNALIESGYMDRREGGALYLHNWDSYAGRLNEKRTEKREKDRERQAKRRDRIRLESCVSSEEVHHADVTRDTHVNRSLTVPHRTNIEREQKGVRSKAIRPPSLEEVQAYISEHEYSVNAQQFVEYYGAAGWHDKEGKPVKNWKQRIISWNGRGGNAVQDNRLPEKTGRNFDDA